MSSKVFCLNLFGIFLIMTVVLSSLSSRILNRSMSLAGCFYKDIFKMNAYLINKRGPSKVGLRTPGFWNDGGSSFDRVLVLFVMILRGIVERLSWEEVVIVHSNTPVSHTGHGVTSRGLILIKSLLGGALTSSTHFLRKLRRRNYGKTCKCHLQATCCRIRPCVSCRVRIVS